MAITKKFFSRKYAKVFAYSNIVSTVEETQSNSDNKLIVHTANGLYQGSFRDFNNDVNFELSKGDDILTIARKLYLSTVDRYESSDNKAEEPYENPLTIELENVTLLSNNSLINMPFVSIFLDQIIGISIGQINFEKVN